MQRECCLDSYIYHQTVGGLKHDLNCHILLGFGFERSLAEEEEELLRQQAKFVVESVRQNLLPVFFINEAKTGRSPSLPAELSVHKLGPLYII